MSKSYTIKRSYSGALVVEVYDYALGCVARWYYPTEASQQRLTKFANKVVSDKSNHRGQEGRDFIVELSDPVDDDFGFRIYVYETRLCACGRRVLEVDPRYEIPKCFMCAIDEKIAAERALVPENDAVPF
jgi:hypothetical protein